MKVNKKKYTSFIISLLFFSSIFIVLSKIIPSKIFSPYFIFPIFFFPLFFFKNIFHYKVMIVFFSYLFIYLFNIIISLDYFDSILKNMVLVVALGIIPTFVGGVKLNFLVFIKYLKNFAFLNFIVLSFYIFKNKDLLKYEKANLSYISIGYFLLCSILVLTYYNIYWEKNKCKKIIYWLIILVLAILVTLYGSRLSTILTYLGILLLLTSYKKILLIVLFFILPLSFFVKKNINIFIQILEKYKINFINIQRLYYSLYNIKDINNLTAGRVKIYKDTLNVIIQNPYGIGIYGYLDKMPQYSENFYPHNIFLEIALQYGIIGLLFFVILLIVIVYKILKLKEKKIKNFFILLFLLNLNLLLSGSYLQSMYFSFLITMIFNEDIYKWKYEHNI